MQVMTKEQLDNLGFDFETCLDFQTTFVVTKHPDFLSASLQNTGSASSLAIETLSHERTIGSGNDDNIVVFRITQFYNTYDEHAYDYIKSFVDFKENGNYRKVKRQELLKFKNPTLAHEYLSLITSPRYNWAY